MTPIDMISSLAALLIGLLLGIQREFQAYKTHRKAFSGVRTFSLVSIFGFTAVRLFGEQPGRVVFLVTIFIFIFISIPVLKQKVSKPGMTTSVALVLVMILGMLVGYGLILESLVISLLVFILLASKERMHRFASILTKEELSSAVRFIAVAIVLLPITYSIGTIHPLIGPGKLFDTVKTVLMIIFVSSMSFTSFIVIKLAGPEKGMKISTFLGGFVNSAASTASISQKSRKNPSILSISLVSVLLTNTSMILKDLILILVLTGGVIFNVIIVPVTILLLVSFTVISLFNEGKSHSGHFDIELGSPFAIIPAAKFALIFTSISISAFLLRSYIGFYGVYAVAIGGLVSTTSVTASLAVLYMGGEISSLTAVITMTLALALGSISKISIIRIYDRRLMRKAGLPLAIVAATAFLLSVLLFFMGK
ncbi:MAG: MgtC/SapB family protein [Candidatus Saliniplasma sp.]